MQSSALEILVIPLGQTSVSQPAKQLAKCISVSEMLVAPRRAMSSKTSLPFGCFDSSTPKGIGPVCGAMLVHPRPESWQSD